VEDKESLKTSTLISKFSDSVKDKIDDFFSDGVVTTGVVVGGIFFASDQLFRMEKLSVSSGTDLVDYSWFEIDKTALGTCFPAPVSLKKVLKESSPPPMVLSLGI